MLLELVGEIFGRRERQAGRDDALDPVGQSPSHHRSDPGCSRDSGCRSRRRERHTYVGSLAKLRNSETRSSEPFSSKSCRKNRAVSMLTPIAANTIEKLSSWPSWTPLVGAPSGFRSVDSLLTRPACRQIWAAICAHDGTVTTPREYSLSVRSLLTIDKHKPPPTHLVVRETGRRKDGDLLPARDRVHDVDSRNTSLNHLLRVDARIRVDRTPVNVEVLFRKHFRPFIDRQPGPVKDPTEHVFRDGEFHARAGKLDVGRVDVDAGRAFKDLDDRFPARDFEDLATADGAVRQGQGDDL